MSYGDDPATTRADYPPEESPRRGRDRVAVGERFGRVDKHIAQLDNQLDELAERLGMVLGPERPTAALAGVPRDPDSPDSQLSQWLEGANMRLASLNYRLRGIAERIDL